MDMDEQELDELLDSIDRLDERLKDNDLQAPLRDEHGHCVPGCSRTLPAPTYG